MEVETGMAALMTLVQTVFDGAVTIGGKIITFMTASGHELALIGPILFILIAVTGVITRFIKN